jgi:hypothetical protein
LASISVTGPAADRVCSPSVSRPKPGGGVIGSSACASNRSGQGGDPQRPNGAAIGPAAILHRQNQLSIDHDRRAPGP